jgi:hypothetical protein
MVRAGGGKKRGKVRAGFVRFSGVRCSLAARASAGPPLSVLAPSRAEPSPGLTVIILGAFI